jgi:hypothetical protein
MKEYTPGTRYSLRGSDDVGDQCSSYDLIDHTVEVFVSDGTSIGSMPITEDNRMSLALVLLKGGVMFSIID